MQELFERYELFYLNKLFLSKNKYTKIYIKLMEKGGFDNCYLSQF